MEERGSESERHCQVLSWCFQRWMGESEAKKSRRPVEIGLDRERDPHLNLPEKAQPY